MRIFFLIIFVSFIAQSGFSIDKSEALEILVVANKNFEEEKFNDAIALYEQIEEEFTSVQLQHNLGLSYFYADNLAQAILHMERARKIRPLNRNVKRNLKLLRENVDSEIVRMPPFFLKAWANGLSNLLSVTAWLSLSMIFMIFAILLLYQYLIKGMDLGLHFYYIRGVIIGLFLSSLLLMAFAFNRHVRLNDANTGIIMKNDTVLRIAAEENSQVVLSVNEGVKVVIQDEIDNFYKIKLEDFTDAWVLKEEVLRI